MGKGCTSVELLLSVSDKSKRGVIGYEFLRIVVTAMALVAPVGKVLVGVLWERGVLLLNCYYQYLIRVRGVLLVMSFSELLLQLWRYSGTSWEGISGSIMGKGCTSVELLLSVSDKSKRGVIGYEFLRIVVTAMALVAPVGKVLVGVLWERGVLLLNCFDRSIISI